MRPHTLWVLTLVSSATFAAAPKLDAPMPVSTPPLANAEGTGAFISAVAGDTTSLVTWSDTRAPNSRKVFATRIDATGVPLDRPFLSLGDADGSSREARPRAAWNGTHFVVVWVDAARRTVLARRVSPSGEVDATATVLVTGAAGSLSAANIVSDGAGTSFVTWVRTGAGGEATRIDASLTRLDVTPLALSATALPKQMGLMWDGTRFMAAFVESVGFDYQIMYRTLTPTGPLGALLTIFFSGREDPALNAGCGATNCFVAFSRGTQLRSAPITNGVVRQAAFSFTRDSTSISAPSISFDGTRYWVTLEATSTGPTPTTTAVAFRMNTAGEFIGSTDFATGSGSPGSAGFVAPSGTFMALLGSTLQLTRIDATGALLDTPRRELDVAFAAQSEGHLAIAGEVMVAAWKEHRDASDVVLARRFSLDGVPLDPQPLLLAEDAGRHLSVMGVVFDGAHFVIGWLAPAPTLMRLTPAGTLLDGPAGVALAEPWARGRMTSDGTSTYAIGEAGNDVHLVRFSSAGAFLDAAPLTIAGTSAVERAPGLCFDGTQVWAGWAVGSAFRVSRLSDAGVALDPAGVQVSVSPDVELISAPDCLATWVATTPQLARLDGSDGLDGVPFYSQATPGPFAVTWDGAQYVGAVVVAAPSRYVVARWSSARPFDFTAPSFPSAQAAGGLDLASDGRGTTFVLNQQFDDVTGMAKRLFLTRYRDLPIGARCDDADACHSGFCVDGVCCDSRCSTSTADCQACSIAAGAAVDGVCGPASGNSCDDANACTTTDVCAAGTCGGRPVECPPPGECTEGTVCVASSGTCQSTAKADGTPCSAGHCERGACVAEVDAGGTGGGGGGSPAGSDGGAEMTGGGTAQPAPSSTGCGCSSGDGFGLIALGLLRRRRQSAQKV